jgi:hypothetical protein
VESSGQSRDIEAGPAQPGQIAAEREDHHRQITAELTDNLIGSDTYAFPLSAESTGDGSVTGTSPRRRSSTRTTAGSAGRSRCRTPTALSSCGRRLTLRSPFR